MKEQESKGQESDDTLVRGERNSAALVRAPSMQSRISNILAIGLMSVLGLGMLTWYYANAMTRQSHARQNAEGASAKRAQGGDVPLPTLGRIDPPAAPMPRPDLGAQPSPLSVTALQEVPLQAAPTTAAYGVSLTKTPAELALERQLSGAVFSAQSSLPTAPAAGIMPPAVSAQEPGELSSLLRPSVTTAVRAEVLPTQRLLLPKGAFLDCTLETAIDSTLPGMTTCVMATDAFGVDGEVVLLERGTKLVGETRGQVQQGSARVFVLWNEARTPTGVIVPLASPGADELGRAGLPGVVDRHFWERFGAAMLVSVIDGAIQAAVQSSRGSNGTVVVNPSATQDVMTEVLKGTINIPPTVVKRQGDRIQVLVARDLDFRSVYELKSTVAGR
ncbi:MAG TPA: type IV secretion system protein VirB10 [Steroidobacteraceae bacterium]|jgi:type IV secretion system protein VirB10|nr:type IV secretion system protein VirB10 [Steroidobacteraceae bacterium]